MATKEDILEQVTEEYLLHLGYFVRHNVKFRPNRNHPDFVTNKDSNHSDIDILAYSPNRADHDRVVAVSCKSWQGGFKPTQLIDAIKNEKNLSGRPAWKGHRELVERKWTEAFIDTIHTETGTRSFTYINAVTRLVGDKNTWENYPPFVKQLGDNPIKILTFDEMARSIWDSLTTTLASTELGRLLQLFRSAGLEPFKN